MDINNLKIDVGNALMASAGVTQYTGSRIYYKKTPDNARKNDLQLQYELQAKNSTSAFESNDISEDYDLNINLIHKSSSTINEVIPFIKDVIINLRNSNIRYTEFTYSDIVWYAAMETYNMRMQFRIVYDK